MITIDAPISFLLGSGLAYAASRQDKADFDAIFLKGLVLQACVLSPVILFFMLRFPDWEWNYMFDARQFFFGEGRLSIGAASIALILSLLNLTYIIGFKLSTKLIKLEKAQQVLYMLGGVGTLIAVIILAMLDQTLHIGTLAEYQNQTAGLIFFNIDFLLAQAGAGVLLTIGFVLTLRGGQQN
jgi:hypothetical protein